VGDSAIDIAAARNAGVAAWAVPYGYDAGAPIADARPDRVFADVSELADHVVGTRTGRVA
jgi:phosphoglycolate phosphatase